MFHYSCLHQKDAVSCWPPWGGMLIFADSCRPLSIFLVRMITTCMLLSVRVVGCRLLMIFDDFGFAHDGRREESAFRIATPGTHL